MVRRARGAIRDALIILSVSFVGVVLVEVSLRVVYGEQGRAQPLDSQQEVAFQSHPNYLVGLKPNLHDRTFKRASKQGVAITHWNTNAHSFRGTEIKDKVGVRIIVYGDSNIFARFSDLEETFPYQLERMLQDRMVTPVEVINAGVPGFGPDQSLLRFEEEVAVYKPDIVVFHVFADNDWGDLIRNRLFAFDAEGHLVRSRKREEVDSCLRDAGCYGIGKEPILSVVRRWSSSLLIVQASKKIMRMMGLKDGSEPSSEDVILHHLNVSEQEFAAFNTDERPAASHFGDHYDYDLALLPGQASSQAKIRLMEAVLSFAYQMAQSHGVRFVLLLEPSSRDLTTNLRPNFEDFGRYPGYSRRRLTGLIVDAATKHEIPIVDLYDSFMTNHPQTLYWDDNDDHWNNAGQRLAATQVAKFLALHVLKD